MTTTEQVEAHACEECYGVTLHWILWQNSRGHQRYFCDNECLLQWVQRCRDHAIREVVLEGAVSVAVEGDAIRLGRLAPFLPEMR